MLIMLQPVRIQNKGREKQTFSRVHPHVARGTDSFSSRCVPGKIHVGVQRTLHLHHVHTASPPKERRVSGIVHEHG